MKKAIIYGRKSTNKQSSESIETQIYECEKWAEENDCVVVDIYDDSGQSGRAYNVGNRSGFNQILQDAKEGRMDYALIHKVDRFARSVLNYYSQEAELEKYGVKLIVVGMPFMQNADIVSKSVHISMAEQFSVNLSNEVSVKMRTFAKKAAYLGGSIPYGFELAIKDGQKTFVINQEQADVVRLIYDLYLQSYGYQSISKILHRDGYFNAEGKQFSHQHIRRILMSKRYNGYYVYGQHETINGKEVRIRDKKKLKEKLIEIPDVFEKIIDDETFQAVQDRMASKAPKNKRKKRFYPFTGKMICGSCGRAVTGSSNRHKDTEYHYYRCLGTRIHGCSVPAIRADYLEDFILINVKKHIFSDAFTAQLIKEIESNLYGDIDGMKRIQKQLVSELASVENQIKEATKDKYAKRIEDRLYDEIMDELEQKRNAIEKRLFEITRNLNIKDKTKEVKKYVSYLKENLEKADKKVRDVFLQQIVYAITLSPEMAKVFINLNTPPSSGLLSLKDVSIMTIGEPTVTIDGIGLYTNNTAPLMALKTLPLKEFHKSYSRK